jgi:small subunit ribosomal protein S4
MSKIKRKGLADRRTGKNILGNKNSPVIKRPTTPGLLPNRNSRLSMYANQLLETKVLRHFYGGLLRRQLKKIVDDSIKKHGNTVDHIIKSLESRLSTVIFRANWVQTPWAAQQLINHGHVLVNGKKVDIKSYSVKIGDEVSLSPAMHTNEHILNAMKMTHRTVGKNLDHQGFKVVYKEHPNSHTVDYGSITIDISSIIAFLAR